MYRSRNFPNWVGESRLIHKNLVCPVLDTGVVEVVVPVWTQEERDVSLLYLRHGPMDRDVVCRLQYWNFTCGLVDYLPRHPLDLILFSIP